MATSAPKRGKAKPTPPPHLLTPLLPDKTHVVFLYPATRAPHLLHRFVGFSTLRALFWIIIYIIKYFAHSTLLMMMIQPLLSLPLVLVGVVLSCADAWLTIAPPARPTCSFPLSATSSVVVQPLAEAEEKTTTSAFLKSILAKQIQTKKQSYTKQQRQDLQQTLQMLEATSSDNSPARSKLVQGTWKVQYTTAPPPSNGVLGIFQGVARQRVELDTNKYCNLLSVGKDWITAELMAKWEEWDGVVLVDSKNDGKWKGDGVGDEEEVTRSEPKPTWMDSFFFKMPRKPDYGATCWLVTFETIEICLFGVSIMKQKFDNVQRVWRTTYVDHDTRIVRAGRTGKRDDEMVFYMTRES